jgi:microcompartment protein CcmL/EutN
VKLVPGEHVVYFRGKLASIEESLEAAGEAANDP